MSDDSASYLLMGLRIGQAKNSSEFEQERERLLRNVKIQQRQFDVERALAGAAKANLIGVIEEINNGDLGKRLSDPNNHIARGVKLVDDANASLGKLTDGTASFDPAATEHAKMGILKDMRVVLSTKTPMVMTKHKPM